MLRSRDCDDTSNTITFQDADSIVVEKSQFEKTTNYTVVTTPYRKINPFNVTWCVLVYSRHCELSVINEENNHDIVEFKGLTNGKKMIANSLYGERNILKLDENFVNGKLSLKFIVTFKVKTLTMSPTNHVYLSCEHYPEDFKLIVEKIPIQVHRHFLAMLSPVFHAMFTHDTVENRTGKTEIDGIDYKSVLSAIDFCYGRKIDLADTNNAIGILRFGDRYDIKSITATLQYIPFINNITELTFCNVLSYAYDMSLGALTFFCAEYFKENKRYISNSTGFKRLPIPVILNLLSAAYGTDDNLEIFNFACKDNVLFITDFLEPYIISGLTVDTFCSTISFTWKYNREKLKPFCAAFFNQHTAEIMNMPEFVNLESDVIKQILKATLDLKNTENARTS